MKRQTGFTLLELMVVIAILGILAATSVGVMAKYRQRTIGSEAAVMMKQIIEAEIIYFLAHNEFFPSSADSDEILVWHNGADPSTANKQRALDALKVGIPTGHLLGFRIYRDPVDSVGSPLTVEIWSSGNFNLFPGVHQIRGTVDKNGKIIGPEAF
jgi:prepilin-type N-terminal cleavage/methylation domain-containing protein